MENIPVRAILSYAQLLKPEFEFKIETHHDKYYLMLVVDVAKTDKNNSEYDEKYTLILRPLKESSDDSFRFFTHRPLDLIDEVTKKIQSFFNVKLESAYSFKNYNYIDTIEEQIRSVLKNSLYPNVEFEFNAQSDNPILEARFYNWDKGKDGGFFIDELEKLLNNKIVLRDNYRNTFAFYSKK